MSPPDYQVSRLSPFVRKLERFCCCARLDERWHKVKSSEREQGGVRTLERRVKIATKVFWATKQQKNTGKLAAVFLLKRMWQLQAVEVFESVNKNHQVISET